MELNLTCHYVYIEKKRSVASRNNYFICNKPCEDYVNKGHELYVHNSYADVTLAEYVINIKTYIIWHERDHT